MKKIQIDQVIDALFHAPFDAPMGAVWKHKSGVLLNRKFTKCADGEALYYWHYDGGFAPPAFIGPEDIPSANP